MLALSAQAGSPTPQTPKQGVPAGTRCGPPSTGRGTSLGDRSIPSPRGGAARRTRATRSSGSTAGGPSGRFARSKAGATDTNAAKTRSKTDPAGLPKTAFEEGYGLQTPLRTGQLAVVRYHPYAERALAVVRASLLESEADDAEIRGRVAAAKTLDAVYSFAGGRDFWVTAPCGSERRDAPLEGTRVTLQKRPHGGFDFTIRTCWRAARASFETTSSRGSSRVVARTASSRRRPPGAGPARRRGGASTTSSSRTTGTGCWRRRGAFEAAATTTRPRARTWRRAGVVRRSKRAPAAASPRRRVDPVARRGLPRRAPHRDPVARRGLVSPSSARRAPFRPMVTASAPSSRAKSRDGGIRSQVAGAAKLFYYWVSFGPLSRGSAYCGYAVLAGTLVAAGLSPCSLPANRQFDWEAILSPTPAAFLEEHAAWLFDGATRASSDPLAGLPPPDDALATSRDRAHALLAEV